MKRLFYLFSVVAMAMALGSSCTKDDALGGETPDNSFATISVVSNDRYYQEPAIGTLRSGEGTNEPNTIKFTVKVDVKDNTDDRDYLIVTMSEELVKNSNISASSYLNTYLSKVDYMIEMAGLETLTQFGAIQNGDLAESENLFHLYPVFPHEKQYVVCVPFENGELVFSEAAISSAISVTRLVDSNTITIPTEVVSYDVAISEETKTYCSCLVNFTGLTNSDLYVYSYMNSSTYEYLSETEIYLRYLEFMNMANYGGCLSDFFAGYYTDLAFPDMIYDKTSYFDTLEVGLDNTGYTIYMFKVDEYGAIAGAFKTAKFTTETYTTPEGELKEFGNVTVSSDYKIDVKIDAGTFGGIYMAQCVSKYEVESAGFSDISDYVANQLELLSYIGMTFTEENEYLDLYTGTTDNFSSNGKTVLPDSDYYIFAVGVDYKGNIITDIITTEFSTPALSGDFTITITANDTSGENSVGNISYEPTDENVTYYYGKIKSTELSGKTDAEIDELITSATYVKSTTGDYTDYGSTTIQSNTVLTADTEYTIFALVLNESDDRLYYNSITKSTITSGP